MPTESDYMGKKINRICGIIMIFLLVMGVVTAFYKRHIFLKNYKFTVGRVTEITPPGWHSSGDYSVLYEYSLRGRLYKNNMNYNYCRHMSTAKLEVLLVGKSFPIAYAAGDESISSMLLTQENADRFHYQLPDSLKIYDSVITCK
jgi:hypothetical protein